MGSPQNLLNECTNCPWCILPCFRRRGWLAAGKQASWCITATKWYCPPTAGKPGWLMLWRVRLPSSTLNILGEEKLYFDCVTWSRVLFSAFYFLWTLVALSVRIAPWVLSHDYFANLMELLLALDWPPLHPLLKIFIIAHIDSLNSK